MSKYHKAFQGFVKVFTGAKQPGVKGSATTIIGVAPSKNIKKFQKQKEKILKTTDKYKSAVNDPEVKKKMNETTSKTIGKISQILKGKKVEKKAMGGRIGRKMGGGSDMGSVADSQGNVGPGTGGYQGGPQGGYGDAGSSNNPSGDRYRCSRREYQQAVNNAAAIEVARKAKEKEAKAAAKQCGP